MFERRTRWRGDWLEVAAFLAGAGLCAWAAAFAYPLLFGAACAALAALALAHLLGPVRRGALLRISPSEMILVLRSRRVVRPQQVQSVRMAEGALLLRLRDRSVVRIPPELDPAGARDYLRAHWNVEVSSRC